MRGPSRGAVPVRRAASARSPSIAARWRMKSNQLPMKVGGAAEEAKTTEEKDGGKGAAASKDGNEAALQSEVKKEEANAMLSKSASDGFDGQYHKSWIAYVDDLNSGKASDTYLEKLLAIKKEKLGEQAGPQQKEDEQTIEFNVKLNQPLGMNIDTGLSDDGSFSAMVTEVKADGQAEDVGIQREMHIIAINGESTRGKTLDDVVQRVIKAKSEQTPLVMSLKKLR